MGFGSELRAQRRGDGMAEAPCAAHRETIAPPTRRRFFPAGYESVLARRSSASLSTGTVSFAMSALSMTGQALSPRRLRGVDLLDRASGGGDAGPRNAALISRIAPGRSAVGHRPRHPRHHLHNPDEPAPTGPIRAAKPTHEAARRPPGP